MKSQKTREKILDVSLELFNEKKASNVSTVQISTAMKISPGNLYYYFANKEEIIRCLWEERMVDEVGRFSEAYKTVKNPAEYVEIVKKCFEHYERYIFFYSEAPTLFINDPELRQLYVNRLKITLKNFIVFINNWIDAGLMVDMTEGRKHALAENIFLIIKSFLLNPEVRESNRIENILVLIEPYFTDKAKSEISDMLNI